MNFKTATRDFLIMTFLCFIAGCRGEPANVSSEPSLQHVLYDNQRTIKYFQDSRTQICFASFSSGSTYGGPSLTAVPCDSVPSELLTKVDGGKPW